jgi:prefoldin subunit 5
LHAKTGAGIVTNQTVEESIKRNSEAGDELIGNLASLVNAIQKLRQRNQALERENAELKSTLGIKETQTDIPRLRRR